jgi:hypothetical protein
MWHKVILWTTNENLTSSRWCTSSRVRFVSSKTSHTKGIDNLSKSCGHLLPMIHLNLSSAQKQKWYWSLNFQVGPKDGALFLPLYIRAKVPFLVELQTQVVHHTFDILWIAKHYVWDLHCAKWSGPLAHLVSNISFPCQVRVVVMLFEALPIAKVVFPPYCLSKLDILSF